MPTPRREWVLWTAFAGASAWLTYVAWRGPPPIEPRVVPHALPRKPTALEFAFAIQSAEEMTQHIRAANRRAGRTLKLQELEGRGPDGIPWIPTSIPDNPLVPGVGGIRMSCETNPPMHPDQPTDWWYCVDSETIRPANLYSTKG